MPTFLKFKRWEKKYCIRPNERSCSYPKHLFCAQFAKQKLCPILYFLMLYISLCFRGCLDETLIKLEQIFIKFNKYWQATIRDSAHIWRNNYQNDIDGHWCIINSLPNNPWFLRPRDRSLLKTLWEKETMLVTSIVSFSHNVFYPAGNKFQF